MPRPLKRGILGGSTIILSKDIDKYAFMCGSNFYESDIIRIVNKILFLFLFSESAYTERYMGLPLPTENFRGYQKSSLLEQSKWINGKDFFLAHGMADRNVHFQNSMILAKTLVSHNVPFEQHVS